MITLLFFWGMAAPAVAGDLLVQIDGIKSQGGKIICRLFTSKSKFPRSGELKTVTTIIGKSATSCFFKNIPGGTYAVAIAHDKNANSKLDTNFLGIPSEGYGFSNNVRPRFSAPRFKQAAFNLAADKVTLRIKVIY